MKDTLRAQLDRMQNRLDELNAQLASQDAGNDIALLRRLNQEHAEVSEVLDTYAQWRQADADLAAAQQMRDDPELREFADEEATSAGQRRDAALAQIETLLRPRDPDDARNAILEIRAGTGGDESALFAGDLLRMYLRHAERRGWQTEILSASESELGGYREVIVQVTGREVFGHLRFESGTHRVQRVPVTESQGRIHTSACTVAVMAEAEPTGDITINPDDLRIDVFRASGAGGQHVNKTESAVRITHLPTGTVAECQDDRSQHRNREKAMTVLLTRLRDAEERARHAKTAAHRKNLVGSGDRSERIRTYNFPQGRMTDHRINLTLYKLQAIMDGDLDELSDALIKARIAEQAAEQLDAAG
ncbi:MAG: peptide chain release factor 1 [Lautropia sp.]|nr:peptide chain release factor 1 [Lautropia sp.]